MSLHATVRSLRRNPWFAATAILTLALGLGAAISIFTVVNRVLLAPLPYPHADRLVWISTWNAERGQYSKSSGFDFNAWKERSETFDRVEAFWDRPYTITGTSRPEGLSGWQFTPGLFALLGSAPAAGRTFLPGEGQPGGDAVVVLSDDLWRRRFDARSTIVGDSLELDGRAHTVIGVMPPTFAHPYPNAQLWTPAALSSAALADRKQRPYRVVARLRDGVSRERAEVELRAIAERLAREHPDTHQGFSVAVRPLRDFYVGDTRPLLWVLQGTACVLLLISVSNVASLLLVRDASRQRETAVRLALGASRLHLLRQHFAEGLTLAGCGGAGGLLLALWGTQLLPRLLDTRLRTTALPDTVAGWIDARVLIATAITVVAVGVMFGVTPLLRRTHGLSGALHSASRGATGDRRTQLQRQAIVTAQIALSVLLLVGAGLLVRSFSRLQQRSFGFETQSVVTAQLVLPRDRYASAEQTGGFLDRLVENVAALPGVAAAAAVNTLPLTGFNALRPYNLPGQPAQERFAEFRIVTSDYFATMAIPIRRGRVFDAHDRSGSQAVIVVNETAARRLWPGADPVGQTLMVPDFMELEPRQVIGVVGDTRHHDLAKDPEPEIYRPAAQTYWPFFGLVVRMHTPTEGFERALRDASARADAAVPVNAVQPLAALADSTWAWRRSSMLLLIGFAAAACVLAFVGVYGLMAFGVAERSREIGVRVALGARPSDVARSILAQAATLTGVGTAVGLALAGLVGSVLGTLLFGVTSLDAPTFVGVAIVCAGAGLLASALPAMTAARVNPTAALKGD
jgi:putative ABC transport system permease protein